MKRKLIQSLLQLDAGNVLSRVSELFPGNSHAETVARIILMDAIAFSHQHGTTDPVKFYLMITGSLDQILFFTNGGTSDKLDRNSLEEGLPLLTDVLTSKAGRKKTSDLSRREQLAAAAARRRAKVKGQERKRLDVWISHEAATYLETIQKNLGCESQADAVESLLDAAIKGKVLQYKPIK